MFNVFFAIVEIKVEIVVVVLLKGDGVVKTVVGMANDDDDDDKWIIVGSSAAAVKKIEDCIIFSLITLTIEIHQRNWSEKVKKKKNMIKRQLKSRGINLGFMDFRLENECEGGRGDFTQMLDDDFWIVTIQMKNKQ